MTNESFDDLLARCREGDEEAVDRVVRQYSGRLLAVARKLLSAQVRRRVDHEDIVQSALFTFFRRVEDGEFTIKAPDDLWKLLVTITVRKAQNQGRLHSAAQRSPAREVNGSWFVTAISRDPGPVEAIVLSEIIEDLTRWLEQEKYGTILERILSGEAKADIANDLGLSKRTVDRVLFRIRTRLEGWIGDPN
ncbi:RNA polymerase factor sigma-70 [Stieleria neptunia]|uniref:RNA polymerase factor sigma-70 n=1 Tax=Stieleria neptunia TaxID=2527979 RepID=A0A518HY38_9BACT|nr:sigma-70 family RNA polymerase sigma factor [Stieleria neptunia]QDV45674.1 RNA polymerase factor sigma-70 [Stieleria neptunia]